MTGEPDFVRANDKISDAKNWRGDVNVTLGDETVTFKHRLLNENEFLNVKQKLDSSKMTEAREGNVGETDAQERVLELQQKEELTEEEEQELQELSVQVAQQGDSIEEALGEDGYELFTQLGRDTIEPSDEDVEYVYSLDDTARQRELMGVAQLPNPLTPDAVREAMTEKLRDMVTEQPYPIKLNVGLQAFSETVSVLGNESQR